MNPRRVAIELWPTLVFGGGLVVLFGCIGLVGNASAVRTVDRLAPSLAANAATAAAPKVSATIDPVVTTDLAPVAANPVISSAPVIGTADVAAPAELLADVSVDPTAKDKQPTDKPQGIVVATLTDPAEVLPQDDASVQLAVAPPDDLPQEDGTAEGRIEIVGECLVAEACIDQFLWALYERTPKLDTTKEREQRKVTVRNKKGKLVKVTKTFIRLVNNDFTWKDPKAAERVGMSMIDYVIGGMDKKFKLKLFRMLYAAENAGLAPGITSAFRDDYRQSIASGLKAASDRSYHGGSFRGGYGRGLAADIVSVKGASRAQRWVSTEVLWKWVDENGKEFGIGRPYLDRDPPHVGPIDGPEYVSRRGGPKVAGANAKSKAANSDAKKRNKQVKQEKPAAKRPVAAQSPKGRST